jgi:Putative peptidoglycan binding domain/L,D-transpeptidase catalytic domain/Sporulation and spore germination
MLRAALLAALVVLLAPAAAQAAEVKVYFTRGEQLAYVQRDVAKGPTAPLKALLAGPTAAERSKGYGTVIPLGVTLTSAKVRGERVEIVLSSSFRTAEPEYHARLAQVVYTATAATGLDEVRMMGKSYTREDFGPEPFTEPTPPTRKLPAPADPKAVQNKLIALGYLPTGAATGSFDYRTMQAVLAFQGWSGLTRDGVVGPLTLAKLNAAGRPLAIDRGPGRRVEIYRARGVVLLISGAKVVRAIHTSTGIGGNSPDIGTPPGKWKIYRKEVKSWSVPYKTWLPNAAYWVGGWALHGYADVPVTPASHGCARLPMPEAKIVYDFVSIGTPVHVI